VYLSQIKWVVYSMASNGIIDFDGKQIYVPEWALDDSVQTLIGISKDMLSVLAKQNRIETDSQTDQQKSNDTNARLLRDISNNTAGNKRGNEEFRENSRRLMSTFISGRNSFAATQTAMDNLTVMSSNLGIGVEDLRAKISDTGLSFESYAKLIKSNDATISSFGTNLATGIRNFSDLSKSIQKSIGSSELYGLSAETLNKMILSEIDVRLKSGRTQQEITSELSNGFKVIMSSIVALSVTTGTAVDDILDTTMRLRASTDLQTFLESGTLESRRLAQILPGLTAIFRTFGDVGDTLLTSVVESIATNTDVMAYENGKVADILNAGGSQVADSFTALVDSLRSSLSMPQVSSVPESELMNTMLSSVSGKLGVLGEEVAKTKSSLAAMSEAGDQNAGQLLTLVGATRDISRNFTMFSKVLDNTQKEVSRAFSEIVVPHESLISEYVTKPLKGLLSRQFIRPDQEGKEIKLGTMYEEMSGFIDRFNRAIDDREQYKMAKVIFSGISLLLSTSIRTVNSLYNSVIRSDMTGAITSLIDGIERVVSKFPILGGILGAVASGASFVLGTVFGALEEYGRALQEMVGVGAGLGQSLEELRSKAASVGLDIGSLSKVIANNARAMLSMGDNVSEGSMNFVTEAAKIRERAKQTYNLFGMNNTELAEAIAQEVELRRKSGMSLQNLEGGMIELLYQTTALANLQGIERKEILRGRQAQLEKNAFSTFVARIGNTEESTRLLSALSSIEALGGAEIATAVRTGLLRGVDPTRTPEFAQAAMLLRGEERANLENLVRAITDYSGVTDEEYFSRITAAGGTFAKSIGDETNRLIGVYGSLGETFAENIARLIEAFRGLPDDQAAAAEAWRKSGENLQNQSAMAIAGSMEEVANTLKTSVLLTAMNMVGQSGASADNLVDFLQKSNEYLYETVEGIKTPLPIDQVFKKIAQTAEQSENPLVSALGSLTDSIISPDGLIFALKALAVAVGAQTLVMGAIGAAKIADLLGSAGGAAGGAGRLSKFGRFLGRAGPVAVLGAGAIGAYQTYTDEEMEPEQKTEEYSGIAGETAGGLGGMWAGAKLGALGGSFAGPIGTFIGGAAGGILGGLGGYLLGGSLGRWLGSSNSPEISGGAGDAEVAGSAGTDTLGTTITQTTEELMLASQLNSRLETLLTKYDEEIEILKTQNQILIDTMARVMETNRILENYVRVYKENVM
jgi:hypothetical protein